MTGEEIRDFLDLEETFTSGDVQKAYSQRLEKEKQALANGGSRAERMMAREKLSRLERMQGDVTSLTTRMRAVEEVDKYLPKAAAHVKAGNFKLADVPFKYVRKVPADLLSEDLQMAVEEMAARIEEGLAGSAAAEAESARKAAEAEKARAEEAARIEAERSAVAEKEKARQAREDAEKRSREEEARRKLAAEEARRQAEVAKARAAEEEKARAEEARLAAKVAEEAAAKKAAEEAARLRHEAAAKKEAEEAARSAAEAAALEKARREKAAAEAAARRDAQSLATLSRAEAALTASDEALAANLAAEVRFAYSPDRPAGSVAARLDAIAASLEESAGRRRMVATMKERLARADSLVVRGDYEGASQLLREALTEKVSARNAGEWESLCRPELAAACEKFALARLAEAQMASRSGRAAAVAPLAAVTERLTDLFPGGEAIRAEFAKLSSVVTLPNLRPCGRMSLEYSRGGFSRRRLQVIAAPSVVFGRAASADVVVRVATPPGDPRRSNQVIGRRHLTIEVTPTAITLLDGVRCEGGTVEASKNGIFLDGRKILYPKKIGGSGEVLSIASAQPGAEVARWALRIVRGSEAGDLPGALTVQGGTPEIAGLYLERRDEIAEDILLLCGPAPLAVADTSLAPLVLVPTGSGLALWDGRAVRDAAEGVPGAQVLSAGQLSFA
jgi:hypothetical protein